jgi:hypothetical protein
MSDLGWIVVPRWNGPDGFQHYKDRDPVWIKNYVRLLDDDDYLNLPIGTRGLLHSLWIAYARADGKLSSDTRKLSDKLSTRVTSKQLGALAAAGFIEFSASKPLALRYQVASDAASDPLALARSREAETEKEKTKDLQAVQAGRATANDDIVFGLGTEGMGYALRLASVLQHKDERTVDVITSFAGKLPPAAFETVREKIAEGNGSIKNDAGYAVAELQRMVDEKQYAA